MKKHYERFEKKINAIRKRHERLMAKHRKARV
jgi:hypothetical protein